MQAADPSAVLKDRPRGPRTLEEVLQDPLVRPRWMGWRLRALMVLALLACVSVFVIAQWLSLQPRLPFDLQVTGDGAVKVDGVDSPALQRLQGHVVEGLLLAHPLADGSTQPEMAPIEPLALQRSLRWLSDAGQRDRYLALHQGFDELLHDWTPQGLHLHLSLLNAPDEPILVGPRGWAHISPTFWLFGLLALMLFGAGMVVWLAEPQWRTAAYAVLASVQAGSLLLIGIEAGAGLLAPTSFVQLDGELRLIFDLVSATAMIQIAVLHPRRMRRWPVYSAVGWLAAALLWWACHDLRPAHDWWGLQIGTLLLSVAAVVLMTVANRRRPHPMTLVMRRFVFITLLTWLVMSVAVWVGGTRPDMLVNLTTFGVMTWHVFAAMQVLLSPYMSRSRHLVLEFSLLAASSTVAACLDLVFVAAFSLGQFTSMTLALFLSFGVYLSVRRWLTHRLPGRDPISMERLFERLYRMAREVERQPGTLVHELTRLMRELFDPLGIAHVHGDISHPVVRGNGSMLIVPMPSVPGTTAHEVLVLKHAGKGRRLFTVDDARLSERIVEQLHRVLRFDQAVEQGRSEERLRIAQDLHDDIGARLLTLMYQAPTPEIEEYIRHTLQDLKTLTRGLAAQSHLLSEAAGEWKRDLTHRLGTAQCELDWQMTQDTDVQLNMVQWSALTRILRELVSNAMSHAKAKSVSVALTLLDDHLTLQVEDNGVGRAPETWLHGLGLGGVRKRVKQLGGAVRWEERQPCGIRCVVEVPNFSRSAHPGGSDAQVSH